MLVKVKQLMASCLEGLVNVRAWAQPVDLLFFRRKFLTLSIFFFLVRETIFKLIKEFCWFKGFRVGVYLLLILLLQKWGCMKEAWKIKCCGE